LSGIIAQIAQSEQAELILCGGKRADWDSDALGAAVAGRLQWPQVTWTTRLELKKGVLTGTHDANEGTEDFEVALPAVVTTQQGLNEPCYPTLPNTIKARSKEVRKQALELDQVSQKSKVVGLSIEANEWRRRMLDCEDASSAAGQLLDLLKDEARAIS
jgi:electron transfer flavoprotein beta subunit